MQPGIRSSLYALVMSVMLVATWIVARSIG